MVERTDGMHSCLNAHAAVLRAAGALCDVILLGNGGDCLLDGLWTGADDASGDELTTRFAAMRRTPVGRAEQGGHPLAQRFDRTGTGPVEENPVLVLVDLGCACEEAQDDGRGVRLGQGGRLQGGRTEGLLEDIGGTSEEEPHRGGQEAGGRRAVAVAVIFHRLAIMFAMATGAIEVFVEPLRCGRRKRGHHQAWGIARAHACGLEHAPPWVFPGPRGRDELVIEAATDRRRLAMGLGQRHPLVLETPRLLDGGSGLAEPDRITREAKDHIGPAARRAHRADRWRGKMTIATDKDVRIRPAVTQRRPEAGQEHRLVCPAGTGARP